MAATVEVVHIDASLIRADVSWESLVERHVTDVIRENRTEEEIEAEKKGRQSGKYKKVSLTDPDATMATTVRNRRLEPCYKEHTTVDDLRGVVLDVQVTTGEVNEGDVIEGQVNEVRENSGDAIKTVTADAGYPGDPVGTVGEIKSERRATLVGIRSVVRIRLPRGTRGRDSAARTVNGRLVEQGRSKARMILVGSTAAEIAVRRNGRP